MCSLCLHSPCVYGCPNRTEEKVYECSCCGDDIVDGEKYYYFNDCYYHEDCFEEKAVDMLLDIGATKGIAGVE